MPAEPNGSEQTPCDDHEEWHARCEYCRGLFGGERATDPDSSTTIRDSLSTADDDEYELAGHLVGTDWVFPQYGVDTIKAIRATTTREQGHRYEHPEVVLKNAGIRLPVSGFQRRFSPNDIGDVEPADQTAERIVEQYG